MSRSGFNIARLAGAAALVAVATTAMIAVASAPRADEMLPDARAKPAKKNAKSGKAQARADARRSAAGRLAPQDNIGAKVAAPPMQSATPSTGNDQSPPTTDPRIDRLIEGARKAWESIGQPAGAPPLASTDVVRDGLKAGFRRPREAREPGRLDAVATLGARLFAEKKLSADHKLSCATCHDPAKSFSDGRARTQGRMPDTTRRNTPSLWNAGFAQAFGWNAGSGALEAQVKAEIEREGEMDGTIEAAVVWLGRDEAYIAAFDRAFGRAKALDNETLAQALAAYIRTLVSPPTRFDRWVDGDTGALSAHEVEGFGIFTGKGGCATCHSGWRFTDDAARSSAGRAVKTPTLREAAWSAPYLFDGRARTLEAAITHATTKRGPQNLTAAERTALSAFVRTLSSTQRP